jgi:hypothetical protein
MNLPPKALTVLCLLRRDLLSAPIVASAGHSERSEESAVLVAADSPRVDVQLQRSPLLSKQRMRGARTTKATIASRFYQRRFS